MNYSIIFLSSEYELYYDIVLILRLDVRKSVHQSCSVLSNLKTP